MYGGLGVGRAITSLGIVGPVMHINTTFLSSSTNIKRTLFYNTNTKQISIAPLVASESEALKYKVLVCNASHASSKLLITHYIADCSHKESKNIYHKLLIKNVTILAYVELGL